MKKNKFWKWLMALSFLIIGSISFAQSDSSAPNACECEYETECTEDVTLIDEGYGPEDIYICKGDEVECPGPEEEPYLTDGEICEIVTKNCDGECEDDCETESAPTYTWECYPDLDSLKDTPGCHDVQLIGTAYPEPECGYAPEIVHEFKLYVLNADVILSGLNSSYSTIEDKGGISPPHETAKYGGILCLNVDDDAGTGAPDGEGDDLCDKEVAPSQTGDDDLVTVTALAEGVDCLEEGSITIEHSGNIALWKESTKETKPGLSYTLPDDYSKFTNDWANVFVEGMSLGGGEIKIIVAGGDIECEDTAVPTVVQLDLDVDSDNDGSNMTGSDDSEDDEELLSDKPGHIIVVNSDDRDNDGVVDWADGFDRDSENYDDDSLSGVEFSELYVKLPDAGKLDYFEVTFSYSASDPNGIGASSSSSSSSSSSESESEETPECLTKPGGSFRIWTKNASSARDPKDVLEEGDYIVPGKAYTPDDLGMGRSKTFYLEAVNPQRSAGDYRICFSF